MADASPVVIASVAFALLMILLAIRIPVALALGLSGFIGYGWLDGYGRAISMVSSIPGELIKGYSLSIVPLFVLMGAVAARSGLSADLYAAAKAMSRSGARGTLATATIGACALFGAICGSSLATAATMTRIAVPEMKRAGYSDELAAGAVAMGGTLGILIPPSVILVIYALLAEESVAKLFAAALIPGILLTFFSIAVVKVLVVWRPDWAPVVPITESAGARFRIALRTWKVVAIFALSVGGIYVGWFSPTEAAAVGAAAAVVVSVFGGNLSWPAFRDSIAETTVTSASLFFVFLGALVYGRFVALTRIPNELVALVQQMELSGTLVAIILILIYLVLGCLLESISMILITVPVFLPLMLSVGYDSVWFGILLVVVVEMGLITPPVGMNLFVIRAQMRDIPLTRIIGGATPFLAAHTTLIAVLLIWPQMTNWLPSLLR